MTTVFIVRYLDYEDSSINGVFTTRKNAQEFLDLQVEKSLQFALQSNLIVKDAVDVAPSERTTTVDEVRNRIRVNYDIVEHELDPVGE